MKYVKKILLVLGIILFLLIVGFYPRISDNKYVQVSEQCDSPNNDFSKCVNPSITKSARKNYPIDGNFHPLTCINTATSFYTPNATCSYCPDFVKEPSRYGFKKTNDPKPGDLIIFYHGKRPAHAGIYAGDSFFDKLVNHSSGGYLPRHYIKHQPLHSLRLYYSSWEFYRFKN